MASGSTNEIMELGYFARPDLYRVLAAGEVGYIATGFKNVKDCRVGDTITVQRWAMSNRCRAINRPSRWSSPACIPTMATISLAARRAGSFAPQRRVAEL